MAKRGGEVQWGEVDFRLPGAMEVSLSEWVCAYKHLFREGFDRSRRAFGDRLSPRWRQAEQFALRLRLPQMPQRQDALRDQLEDVRLMATRLGCYDAADVIESIITRDR